MTRIDRMQELMNSLRAELLSRSEKRTPSSKSAAAAEGAAPPPGDVVDFEPARQQLSAQLRHQDLTSEHGRYQARLLFIEAVLATDLGGTLTRDPQFTFLVRNIERAMAADQATLSQLDEMLSEMTRPER